MQAAYETDGSKVLALLDVIVVGALIRCSGSTRKPPHLLPHLLVTRVCVDGRRERADMPDDFSLAIMSQGLPQAHN